MHFNVLFLASIFLLSSFATAIGPFNANRFTRQKTVQVRDRHGHLSEEFTALCDNTRLTITYDGFKKQCRNLGDGWQLASIGSAEANTAAKSVVPAGSAAWVGGTHTDYVWSWTEGRLAGKVFYRGTYDINANGMSWRAYCRVPPCAAPAGMYSNFDRSKPIENGKGAPVKFLFMRGGLWRNGRDEVQDTKCIICQRELCTVEMDCIARNTESVEGVYTKCRCKCKSGYSGPKCETAAPTSKPAAPTLKPPPQPTSARTTKPPSSPHTGPYDNCQKAVAVPGNIQRATDAHCAPCANGRQTFWPCEAAHVNVLCKCIEGFAVPIATPPPTGPYATCAKVVAVPGNPKSATDAHCAPCANGRQSFWPCEADNVNVLCKCS